MSIKNFEEEYNQISKYVFNNHIKTSLDRLKKLIENINITEYRNQYNKYLETYQNIIKYTILGVKDPQRENVYTHLKISIIELLDRVKHYFVYNHDDYKAYGFYLIEKEAQKYTIDKYLLPLQENEEQTKESKKIYIESIFNRLWLITQYTDKEIESLNTIVKSEKIHWTQKSVFISAITLSTLRFFHQDKIMLLINFFEHSEKQAWHRALVGLILVLYKYDNRIHLYDKIINRLENLKTNDKIENYTQDIIIQLVRTLETEKLSQKLNSEIIPEMSKITPKLNEKLDLENLVNDDLSEDKNPDWENVFEDSPDLLDKMAELSQKQMEGSDVLISTFAMLKHFDFFRETLMNWFMPFHKENEHLKTLDENEKEINTSKFFDLLQTTPFMCNSDKYSFCFNIVNMPPTQKKMLSGVMLAELNSMKEIAQEDEVLNKPEKDRYIFTQYIQDLYRFFKLHPAKDYFIDIFDEKLTIFNMSTFDYFLSNMKKIKNIGELYFSQNEYEASIDLFSYLLKKQDEVDCETFQKIAFSHQKLKQYDKALDFYQKAELFDKNKTWNTKKMAFCYLRLGQTEKALEKYFELLNEKPENLNIHVNIGRCYLDMNNYQEALKYYFKVEFLAPSNKKVLRPIAWCLFLQGKYESAEKYILKIIEIEGNMHDFMILAHIKWCENNIKEASENYLKSLAANKYDLKTFAVEFTDDKKYLLQKNIEEIDIKLMEDYIRYEFPKLVKNKK